MRERRCGPCFPPNHPYAKQRSWLDRLEAAAKAAGAGLSHLDGVRADFADGWLLLRRSVTAEQVTLRAEARAAGAELSHLDGVRADFADGWLLLRRSVTAEQVTLRAEARTPERLRELLTLAASALPSEAQEALRAAFNG